MHLTFFQQEHFQHFFGRLCHKAYYTFDVSTRKLEHFPIKSALIYRFAFNDDVFRCVVVVAVVHSTIQLYSRKMNDNKPIDHSLSNDKIVCI